MSALRSPREKLLPYLFERLLKNPTPERHTKDPRDLPEAFVYTIANESDQETEVQWLRTVLAMQTGQND